MHVYFVLVAYNGDGFECTHSIYGRFQGNSYIESIEQKKIIFYKEVYTILLFENILSCCLKIYYFVV